MLLNAHIFGVGGAANKACIELMNTIPELTNSITLVNTTMKDIPLEYRDKAIELSGPFKGCGKERDKANKIMLDNLKAGTLDYVYDPEDAMCIVATSSEGGTGSGGSIMLAKYLHSVYKMHVHFYIFTGFGDDGRSLKNTVDLFQELDEDYSVQAISNAKFLTEANGNRVKAEELANKKFCDDVKILLGGYINESEQNIDESDLLKIDKTPGYMVIENIKLDKIKNVNDYNTKLIEALDSSKNLNFDPTCKRYGLILNIKSREADFVDYSNSILKERYGMPFESFLHIQDVYQDNEVQLIVSGLKLPKEDIIETYETFIDATKKVDVSKDEFFSMEMDTNADGFDNLSKTSKVDVVKAKADFFNEKPNEPKLKTNTEF